MKNLNIKPNLLKIINDIAKVKQISENAVVNDLITRGIMDLDENEEEELFKDGIDIELVAAEFGQTKEELIKELDEARAEIAAGKGIKLDVDDLDKMFEL